MDKLFFCVEYEKIDHSINGETNLIFYYFSRMKIIQDIDQLNFKNKAIIKLGFFSLDIDFVFNNQFI